LKNRIVKPLASAAFAVLLCVALASPARAAINPFAQMEAESRRAVETAIAAGVVPPGTTIYDCEYGADANGVTVVIRYKDQNGNWLDAATGQKAASPQAQQATEPPPLSAGSLADYAEDVYRLTNEARAAAGLAPLTRDAELDAAAMIRAEELSRKFSHERPDGTRFYSVFDVEVNYNYAENGGSTGQDPQTQVTNWLNSEGHRANILDEKGKGYTAIGVGVFQAENGKLFWCQLFYRPI
jgi:uncharacterized protein YkwD